LLQLQDDLLTNR